MKGHEEQLGKVHVLDDLVSKLKRDDFFDADATRQCQLCSSHGPGRASNIDSWSGANRFVSWSATQAAQHQYDTHRASLPSDLHVYHPDPRDSKNDRVGDNWRKRYKSLVLHGERSISLSKERSYILPSQIPFGSITFLMSLSPTTGPNCEPGHPLA